MKRTICMYSMLLAFIVLFASGCAVGNKHRYHDVIANVNVSDSIGAGIATHDQREYVISGKKNPNFVGLSRGGYGNTFDVGTVSGRNLADDMTEAITSSLSKKGYKAIPVIVSYSDDQNAVLEKLKATEARRLILLTLHEWKSDTYTNTALIFNLTLKVFDQSGQVLADKQIQGRDNLKGSVMNPPKHAKKVVPIAFRQKIEELFNDPAVEKNLH